jgi:hypothetical protein
LQNNPFWGKVFQINPRSDKSVTLDDYLISTKTTSRQFAIALKVSLYAVRKWRQGCRTPRPLSIKKIQALTLGKVKPKDWYQ